MCVLCSFKTKKSSLFIFRFINFAKTKSEFRASKDALLFSLIIFKVSRIILWTNTHLPPPVEAGKSPLVWGFGNKNEVRHSAPYPVQTATDMTNGNCLNVSPLFHRPQVWQDQPLRVQRQPDPAEVATLTTPDRLSSIGSQSRMKNRVSKFYISTICCISCTLQFVLFPQTQKTAGSTTPGSPCTTPSGSSRELVMGLDPPPHRGRKTATCPRLC